VTLWGSIAVIGAVAGGLAAAMAYLITYQEYSKHYYPQRAPAARAAGQMAVVTLVFLVALGAWIGWTLQRMPAAP